MLDWAEFHEQAVPVREGDGPVLSGEEDPRWVQCESCHLWYHFVCGLYDEQSFKDGAGKFFCVSCIQKDATLRPCASWAKHPAESLPHTHLSKHVEDAVAADLAAAGISCEPVHVRVISSVFEQSHCPEDLVQRMWNLGGPYPSEFPYRSKALVAFQKVDGMDIAFFAMYVQEYGDDCPEPNKNRVYISYLDSVRYFESEPGRQRTLVYHSVLVAYLAYVRTLGFKWVHIWVEPPKAGDEYIFFARPDQHKKPMKRDKLRSWYVQMLDKAKDRDIVAKFGSMADLYSEMTSIREIPLFHGDQWAITIPELLSRIEQEHQEAASKAGHSAKVDRLNAEEVVQRAQTEIQHLKRHFLVARLKDLDGLPNTDLDPEVTNELANSREVLLGHCQASHWQFNSVRYAQYSTMMLLNNFHRKPRFCVPTCTRGRKEDGSKMVGCDVCDNWFHTSCLGLSDEQAETMKSYVCASCAEVGIAGLAGEEAASKDAAGLPSAAAQVEAATEADSAQVQQLLASAGTDGGLAGRSNPATGADEEATTVDIAALLSTSVAGRGDVAGDAAPEASGAAPGGTGPGAEAAEPARAEAAAGGAAAEDAPAALGLPEGADAGVSDAHGRAATAVLVPASSGVKLEQELDDSQPRTFPSPIPGEATAVEPEVPGSDGPPGGETFAAPAAAEPVQQQAAPAGGDTDVQMEDVPAAAVASPTDEAAAPPGPDDQQPEDPDPEDVDERLRVS